MSKSDFDGLNSDDADARLTHEGLSHEGFGDRDLGAVERFGEKPNWRRVLVGTLVLIGSVGGAAYWAGGREVNDGGRSLDTVRQTQAALAPGVSSGTDGDRESSSNAAGPIGHAVTLVAQAPDQVGPVDNKPRPSVSFFEPIEGQTVGSTMQVRGMAKSVPEARHLWLVTSRAAATGFWPKERIELGQEGIFEMQVWDFGDDGQFSICLMATDAVETRRFEDWLSVGDRDGVWPALERNRARGVTLGCQELKLDKRLDH